MRTRQIGDKIMSIQWFPGHMAKTKRLITENIKLVDVVVELADARLPESSRNPIFAEIMGAKPRVMALTKEDLAEPGFTKKWLAYYGNQGITALALNAARPAKNTRKLFLNKIRQEAAEILEKKARRGIIDKTVRTMIVGIPNVGKSTLINFVAGRNAAETGDRPGVTKGKQWIRLEGDIELLDMPGILWPKIEDREVSRKLALTGAISDNIYNPMELAVWFLDWLRLILPGRITERYRIQEEGDGESLLSAISRKRGFLRSGGEVDREKGAIMLIDEFRGGKLGAVTLDREIPREE